MSNSTDYATVSIQPHHTSSKQQPSKVTISNNQGGELILRPSKVQLTRDESDQDPADHPLQLASTATKPNKSPSWSQYVYRECQKNHAASMGKYVVDGCGEFMPSGEVGTAQALECAACACHRSFHRREIEGSDNSQQLVILAANENTYHKYSSGNEITIGARRSGRNHNYHQSMVTENMASGRLTDSSSEDLNMFRVNVRGREKTILDEAPSSKKRFRTKFSKEQRVRMQQLAENLGWKIQKKEEEELVEQLCNEFGVKRQVFKVWMHNNKQKEHHNKVA